MSEISRFKANTFCWADLPTTDVAAAKKFYSALFGWNSIDIPAGADMFYTMFEKNGKLTCATYAQSESMRQQGMTAFWQVFVSVENVDNTVEQAIKAGASVTMPAADVFQYGRMAVIQDTGGAALALWQAGEHHGAQVWNEAGAICWNELYSRDPAKSAEFYGAVFGWTTHIVAGAEGEKYTIFKNGETSVAGMLQIQKDWDEVPPNWSVYFAIDNLDAALEKVKALGGTVETQIMQVETEGRFCVVSDPQGAFFLLMEMARDR